MGSVISETETESGSNVWLSAGLAGIVGTVVFGAVQMVMGATGVIAVAIPALYGVSGPNLLAGWAIHLVHGALLGLGFGLLATRPSVGPYVASVGSAAAVGLAYGLVLTIPTAGIAMPLWLAAVGFPNAPPLPNLTLMGFVGHGVYGLVLGAVFPVLRDLL
ncbi:histidine kinase [Salinigranum marinum]|uniref:histidine kinase n=1 Tax=Salinigranum marinum TaxID=1515595 RepID=UPI002989B745|nr:histidine kinase [Salinigranum marinum]